MKRCAFLALGLGLAIAGGASDSHADAHTASWSGFYIGAHGGGGWGDVDATLTSITGSYNVDGFLIGGQAGWNWQEGPFVIGVVADASLGDIDGKWVFDTGPPARNLTTDYDFLGTGRLRAGYATDQFLIYGSGGIAMASVKSVRSSPAASDSDFMVGYAAGGGLEFVIDERWTMNIEYLYRDFGNQALANYDLDQTLSTVTLGINMQLD